MPGLFIILLVGLLVVVAAATWWTMHRLRRPPRRTYGSAVARNIPGDPGELPTPRAFETFLASAPSGGGAVDVPVWDIEGDDPEGPVVVCTPGWGDSKLGALARLDALAPVASRIIAWDPPGAGDAPGLCALGTREHEGALAIVEQLSDQAQRRGVVLYGWSLGAGSSIAAAAEDRSGAVIGVIAEAPYRLPQTPARNVIRNAGMPWRVNGPLAFALLGVRLGVGAGWRGFDRADHARRVRLPLLVIHGSADDICPADDGRAIAHAAERGMFIAIEGAGHNDLWADDGFKAQCQRAARDFISSLKLKTRQSESAGAA